MEIRGIINLFINDNKIVSLLPKQFYNMNPDFLSIGQRIPKKKSTFKALPSIFENEVERSGVIRVG